MTFRLFLFLLAASAVGLLAHAQESARWDSIGAADWAVTIDSSKGFYDAVHLFEKVTVDDGNLNEGERWLTYYQRIRIFSPKGRQYGDVVLPYRGKAQKIEDITGRTILRDGTIIKLSENEIYDEDAIKDDKSSIKRKKFSLPGLTDDCIVEYRFRKRIFGGVYGWYFQTSLPLLRGELQWKYYRPWGDLLKLWHSETRLLPSYQWVTRGELGTVESFPGTGNPEEYRFSIHNIAGIEAEPSMPDPESFASKLVLYYSEKGSSNDYWTEEAKNAQSVLDKFTSGHDNLKQYLPKFTSLLTDEEKVHAVYSWIQSDFRNVAWAEEPPNGEKFKENSDLNAVLERHYGDSFDLNMLFMETLKQLGVDVAVAYVMDRSDGPFLETARYWQFGQQVILVRINGAVTWYYPGIPNNPAGIVPIQMEGGTALILPRSTAMPQFMTVPFSPADVNRVIYRYETRVGENGALTGHFICQRYGQSANQIRFMMYGASPRERGYRFAEFLRGGFEKIELDSVEVDGIDSIGTDISVHGAINFPGCVQSAGKKLLVTPFGAMAAADNIFRANHRSNPIELGNASLADEEITVHLPEGYSVSGLPGDSSYVDSIGSCVRHCSATDTTITFRRLMKLNGCVFPAEKYPAVQKLYHAIEMMDRTTFVLEEKPRRPDRTNK